MLRGISKVGQIRLILGDCAQVLRTLDSETVQTCITSPPYYGLRDYGVDGQIGHEATPQEYVSKLVQVFREVRRVLKKEGTLWLNLGDCYAGSTMTGGNNGLNSDGSPEGTRIKRQFKKKSTVPKGLKAKDLIGIPWRVALALQVDGWYLRSDIIWAKPNPMPESVKDRPTRSHEYIFLLSKSAKYFYDIDAVREPYSPETKLVRPRATNWGKAKQGRHHTGNIVISLNPKGRNSRSVWTLKQQTKGIGHVATMPPELVTPCVMAGSWPRDTVLDPFSGAGTTGLVATQLGRNYLGIDLNPEYLALTERRYRDAS